MRFLVIFLLLVVGMSVYAQSVKVDGVIGEKEYSKVFNVDKNFTIYVSYDSKNVYVGMVANSKGWVSVGFGSPVMDKSIMYIGYYDAKAKKFVVDENLGVKHSHVKVDKPSVINYAGSRDNNQTTFEIVIPRKIGNVELVGKVPVIWAYSTSDSIKSYHSKRGGLTIEF